MFLLSPKGAKSDKNVISFLLTFLKIFSNTFWIDSLIPKDEEKKKKKERTKAIQLQRKKAIQLFFLVGSNRLGMNFGLILGKVVQFKLGRRRRLAWF